MKKTLADHRIPGPAATTQVHCNKRPRKPLTGMMFQQHGSTHEQESGGPWEVHAYPNETQAVLHRPWRLALYRAAMVRLNHALAQ
jgi:hypothetical protein